MDRPAWRPALCRSVRGKNRDVGVVDMPDAIWVGRREISLEFKLADDVLEFSFHLIIPIVFVDILLAELVPVLHP